MMHQVMCHLIGHVSLVCIYSIYAWNPNDHCFDWKRPCFGGLTFKNRGHLCSSYIFCIYIYLVELYSNLTHFVETPTLVAKSGFGKWDPGFFHGNLGW